MLELLSKVALKDGEKTLRQAEADQADYQANAHASKEVRRENLVCPAPHMERWKPMTTRVTGLAR